MGDQGGRRASTLEAGLRVRQLENELADERTKCRRLEQVAEEERRAHRYALGEVRRQAHVLRQERTAAIMDKCDSLLQAAPGILESLCSDMRWRLAALWLVDKESGTLRCLDVWQSPERRGSEFELVTRQFSFVRGVGLPGRTWAFGSCAWIVDVTVDPNFPRAPAARAEGLRSGCAFPITVDGVVHGVVEFFTAEALDPDEELLATLQAIGARIGQAIERKNAQRSLRDRDLEIARHIQTAILPRDLRVEGLEIAAAMHAADEVGGDYYDVLPCQGGCWIGIGDVSGHGLATGLVMLMVQSAMAALVRALPDAGPRELVSSLNSVVFHNLRRLRQKDFVTLSLLRIDPGGHVRLAGAHEDILVCRAATGRCEQVPTPGTWLGVRPEVDSHMVETHIDLEVGDLLVLYTDGLTEAKNRHGDFFGIERVMEEIERSREESAAAIRDRLTGSVRAFMAAQDDDISVLVVRRTSH